MDENAMVDLVDGRLSAEQRACALDHIEDCAACRRIVVATVRMPESEAVVPGPRQFVGRYEILDFIGEGSMGVVYLAHDPSIDRRVALKVVHPDLSNEQERPRLLSEARALGKLGHPNVVAVYDAGAVDGTVFVASELVVGLDLRRHLERHRPGPAAILEMFVQAGAGLAAAHRSGLVHLDFKADNVLVGDDGRIRVADFGLAAAEGARGVIWGTRGYMAPEQERGDRLDGRTDQFAFCVALGEALARRRTRPDEPARIAASIPRRTRRALLRGCSDDPADRFADMDALLTALRPPRRFGWGARLGAAGAVAGLLTIVGPAERHSQGDALPAGVPLTLDRTPDPALANAQALRLAGDLTGAVAQARAVGDEARRQGHTIRAIEADLLLGKALTPTAEANEAVDVFWRVATAAEAAGRPDLHSEALIALALYDSSDPRAAARGATLLDQAERMIERYALHEPLGHTLAYARATLEYGAGRDEAALIGFRAALDQAERVLPSEHTFLVQYRWSLGITLSRLGRHREAIEILEHAVQQSGETLEQPSPRYALLLFNLAAERANTGDCQSALGDFEVTRQILLETIGPGASMLDEIDASVADCLERTGHADQAHAMASARIERRLRDGRPHEVAEAYCDRGDLEYRRERYTPAQTDYASAWTWVRRGALQTALAARVLTRQGLVGIEAGNSYARESLEEAVALYDVTGGTPLEIAEAEFGLARALTMLDLDPDRALALAQHAQARLDSDGVIEAEHRHEIEAWLAERERPPAKFFEE